MAYVVGPTWFYGIDYVFDLVSVVVAILICVFSYRAHRYTQQKRFFYFSASFFFIAAAFIAKIMATIPVYSKELKVETVGVVEVTQSIINPVTWINQFSISISRFLMLFAFLILLMVTMKVKDKRVVGLFIYFLVISTTLVSVSYLVFHVTLLIMLSIIFHSYRKNYNKVKSKNSRLVAFSFLSLTASQVFFIFEGAIAHFYVIGESIQLVGFLILLAAVVPVIFKK